MKEPMTAVDSCMRALYAAVLVASIATMIVGLLDTARNAGANREWADRDSRARQCSAANCCAGCRRTAGGTSAPASRVATRRCAAGGSQ